MLKIILIVVNIFIIILLSLVSLFFYQQYNNTLRLLEDKKSEEVEGENISIENDIKVKEVEERISELNKVDAREFSMIDEYEKDKTSIFRNNDQYRMNLIAAYFKLGKDNKDKTKYSILAISDILKKLIESDSISNEYKNKYYFQLASLYTSYGMSDDVLKIVYSGDYKKYYDKNSVFTSARNLLLEAQKKYRTAYSSARIASYYISDLLTWKVNGDKEMFNKYKEIYMNQASEYLRASWKIADANGFKYDTLFYSYKMWSSYTRAGLFMLGDSRYANYKEKYLDYINILKKEVVDKLYANAYLVVAESQIIYFISKIEPDNSKINIEKITKDLIFYDKASKNKYAELVGLIKNRNRKENFEEILFTHLLNNIYFKDYYNLVSN